MYLSNSNACGILCSVTFAADYLYQPPHFRQNSRNSCVSVRYVRAQGKNRIHVLGFYRMKWFGEDMKLINEKQKKRFFFFFVFRLKDELFYLLTRALHAIWGISFEVREKYETYLNSINCCCRKQWQFFWICVATVAYLLAKIKCCFCRRKFLLGIRSTLNLNTYMDTVCSAHTIQNN